MVNRWKVANAKSPRTAVSTSKWTCFPNKVTSTMAKANKKGNTIPIAESGRI